MEHIGVEQRRARLGVRHRLATPAASVPDAARSLVAVHATDPAAVFLSLRARARGAEVAAIEHALYEERSL
ncbi:MAG TPA: winged helix DNA-binding domain-containing protein, partial [Rugosimonospora sp.]|nr:winged helix DNA-binding domain-containing protein [Rugosimonospora sp.]